MASGAVDRRRAVLLGAGVAAGAGFLTLPGASRLLAAAGGAGPRVAVVGAGTAGLTAAYRLRKANVRATVYEAGYRVGGRMYTERRFNDDGMFVERGGELVDTGHADLIALCGELGLGLETFATGDQGLAHEVFFAGGRVRSEEEVIRAFAPLAAKLKADRALLAGPDGSPAVPTYDSPLAQSPAVVALDRTTLRAYLEAAGIDAWLRELIDSAYVGEFGLESDRQSALNLITMLTPDTTNGFHVFGESDEAMRIKGGSQSLPSTLAAALGADAVVQGHALVRVKRLGTGALALTFDTFGGPARVVQADVVVLALPFSVLRDVEGLDTLGLTPAKLRCIREITYGTNAKLMLGYRGRPWREGPPKSNGTMITTLGSQAFWETSRLQPGASGILTNFLGGTAGRTIGPGRYALALADVDRVVPGSAAKADGRRLLQHWSAEPLFRGSYTCQGPGAYTTLWGAAGQPELDGHLLFAGEHCSVDYGGYMNGAVQSGNAAAAALLARLNGPCRATTSGCSN